uniref:hypothetical protein n=1 Tax=Thaumasiovibrio occultus TaxID=1891184 RepID=UPI00131C2DC8|nr:hypothetical protein [Thaumasiovibrio occultus]
MIKAGFIGALVFLIGIATGGYFFSDTKQRPLLKAQPCTICVDKSELLGIISSVGIQKTPMLIPNIVYETDKTLVLDLSAQIELVGLSVQGYENRYILIPKHDIPSVSDYTPEDIEFIVDLHQAAVTVIEQKEIQNYKFWTSGPARQHVNYLHYHLAF